VPGWARETAWLGAIVVLLVAGVLFAFFELPAIVVTAKDLQAGLPATKGSGPPPTPTAVDLVQARNGVRTAAVALIAGIGAAMATGFAGRTFYLTRRAHVDGRYTTAVEQLGTNAAQVQVSAIGELEQLAWECPSRHRQIMRVLTTFVCEYDRAAEAEGAPASVQAAFDVLAHRRHDRLVLHLQGADLRQVVCEPAPRRRGLWRRSIRGARLRGAVLRDARLDGASLRFADLRDADLLNAIAPSIRLDDARLADAILEGAQLHAATLDRADARGAAFREAKLSHASMRATDLRDTDLDVEDARVRGARTEGALFGVTPTPWWRRASRRVARSNPS
jgi:Pentapeptide repeats (8 copies)